MNGDTSMRTFFRFRFNHSLCTVIVMEQRRKSINDSASNGNDNVKSHSLNGNVSVNMHVKVLAVKGPQQEHIGIGTVEKEVEK